MPRAKTLQDPIKYLKREYGLRPLDDLAAVLGTPPLEVEKMASRLGIPKLFAREGVMSSVQTASALGVSPTTVMKWSREKLAPARFGYMRNQQVLYFQREELTHWLMRPKPAWMLVKVEQVTDPIFATVMRNSQEEFPSPWLSLHEAASGILWFPKPSPIMCARSGWRTVRHKGGFMFMSQMLSDCIVPNWPRVPTWSIGVIRKSCGRCLTPMSTNPLSTSPLSINPLFSGAGAEVRP